MQSEANGPVWGPGIVPIILRNLCPGCKRLRLDTETEAFYPTDFKPEGPDHMAEGWCNGVGCMPGEQGVPGSYGAEHWSSPNGCHPDCPACAAEPVEELSTVVRKIPVEQPSFLMGVDRAESEELRAGKQTRSGLDCLDDMLSSGQVGPKGEDGPTGPCGGPVGPCGPDCVRFVTVSALPAGQPNRNEDIISPDAIVGTPLSQPNIIQALWEKSEVSTPVDHSGIRGISIPQFVREHSLAEDKGWPKPLFEGFSTLPDKLFIEAKRDGFFTPEFEQDLKDGMYDSRWVTEVLMRGDKFSELPRVDLILLLLAAAKWYPKPANFGHRGPVGPCGPPGDGIDACNGDCRKFLELQPDYETATSLSCREIKRFRFFYRQLEAFEFIWQGPKTASAAELVLMPKELTAENGAKALLSGEFYEELEVANPDYDPDCDDPDGEDYDEETAEPDFVTEKVPVTWDTIKKIYKMCVEGLSQPVPENKA